VIRFFDMRVYHVGRVPSLLNCFPPSLRRCRAARTACERHGLEHDKALGEVEVIREAEKSRTARN